MLRWCSSLCRCASGLSVGLSDRPVGGRGVDTSIQSSLCDLNSGRKLGFVCKFGLLSRTEGPARLPYTHYWGLGRANLSIPYTCSFYSLAGPDTECSSLKFPSSVSASRELKDPTTHGAGLVLSTWFISNVFSQDRFFNFKEVLLT